MPDYQRTCPTCGNTVEGAPYDIGSGPELSCPNCETCFGAENQPLNPDDPMLSLARDTDVARTLETVEGGPYLMLAFSACHQCGKSIASRWTPENGAAPVLHCDDHQ